MSDACATVRVLPRAVRPGRRSHPWIFRDDLQDDGGARSGEAVRVVTTRGHELGWAVYSERSRIALRRLAEASAVPAAGYWAARALAALAYREDKHARSSAWRVLFSESDGIPGLIADLYGEHLVVQCLTPCAERVLPEVLEALRGPLTLKSVLARNDASVRHLEGLEREVLQIEGQTPERIEIAEDGVQAIVDPWHGQKTGAFLDQRENRAAARGYCRGAVLDVFTYQGGFALHAATVAERVVAIDSSREALARAAEAAALNGLCAVEWVEAKAFDELRRRERAGERFSAVILDPPAFAKSRRDLPAALRAYREINLRAMRLLDPGGILVTSSCSYNLDEVAFDELLCAAAADAGRTVRIVERRTQSRDHPIRLGFPESHYLKCLVLSVA